MDSIWLNIHILNFYEFEDYMSGKELEKSLSIATIFTITINC